MRQFAHPNMTNFFCPICHTSTDAPVVLVAIPGTEHDNLVECKQVHSECYAVTAKMHGVTVEIKP